MTNQFKTNESWADRIDKSIRSLPSDSSKLYYYLGSCVVLDGSEITKMSDTSTEITLKTFRKYCDTAPFEVALGYGKVGEGVLRLSKDPHISYFRSTYAGQPALYLVHSAIEYIWVQKPVTETRYSRQIFQVEVLGNEPLPGDITLAELHYQITEGHYSGQVKLVKTELVNGKAISKLLLDQGSDPQFLLEEDE